MSAEHTFKPSFREHSRKPNLGALLVPRQKSLIPAYRKHSSGNARVTINGRDYLLGPHGTRASKREYDRLIAEYLASGRSVSFGTSTDQVTMAMLMADYTRHAKKYYGTGSSSDWHRIKLTLHPVKEFCARYLAHEFGPSQFKTIRQSMVDQGLSRTGINARMKLIVRMFRWGASEGLIPAAVHETLRLIPSLRRGRTEAKETEPIQPVSQEVVEATLPHLSQVVADMVRLQLLIGCRPAEICKLTPATQSMFFIVAVKHFRLPLVVPFSAKTYDCGVESTRCGQAG